MNNPSEWAEDLWTIYTGFMVEQGELGHNPRASDLFCTFRELVFFFQKLENERRRNTDGLLVKPFDTFSLTFLLLTSTTQKMEITQTASIH
jgi:hypothetical protein